MDGFPEAAEPAAEHDARRWLRYGRDVAEEIVRRTEEGESLRSICDEEGMPSLRKVTGWIRTRPAFAEAMQAARVASGYSGVGRRTSFCRETAEAIFQRLCDGEGLVRICQDPDMPVVSTVYKWIRDVPAFGKAIAVARQIQGDRLGEEGWRLAMEATPETAYLTHVRLTHLRWYAAKLSPRKYGTLRAAEADEGQEGGVHYYIRRFTDAPDPDLGGIVPEIGKTYRPDGSIVDDEELYEM